MENGHPSQSAYRPFGSAILRLFFWTVEHAPWFARRTGRLWLRLGWSRKVTTPLREALLVNAARILGPDSTEAERHELAQDVAMNFYHFVIDFGQHARMSREELLHRIAWIEGNEMYQRVRQRHSGAIIATAHLGSFEVGMAAMADREQRVHVVFQRDLFERFEVMRSGLRRRLGVAEARVEEGWPMWLRLREALAADEVVLLQADRTMPGQKGQSVPFLGGHVRMPTGPVRLAMLTGSPIIPVFALRQPDGRVGIVIEEPILVPTDGGPAELREALHRLARVIERQVRAHPQQWLVTQPAWVEDQHIMTGSDE